MKFEYEIRYSDRKTLNISVERDRSIVVRAPKHVTEEKIQAVVHSRQEWIKDKLAHVQKYPAVVEPKEFVSGESLLYLGKNYQLSLVNEPIEGVQFNQRFIISQDNQHKANEMFREWYINQAKKKIKPVAQRYAKRLGVEYEECKVSEMKYRWGSCTPKGNIIFNWRIIKAPMQVVEYLVAHELAHLIEPNHTDQFWHILSIQIPNYSKHKEWLKLHGHLLEVDF